MRTSTLADRKKIDFCKEYSLDSNEYDLLIAIRIAQEGSTNEFFDLAMHLKSQGISLRELLISLKDKKVILKDYKVPMAEWSTDDERLAHEFDIWINPKTSEIKMYKSNQWNDLPLKTELLKCLNFSGERVRLFINPASTPYSSGDLIINNNVILKANASRRSGYLICKHFEKFESKIGDFIELFKSTYPEVKNHQLINLWNSPLDPSIGGDFEIRAVPISKNVINKHLKASYDMFREIFELYPKYLKVGDKLIPATNFTRYYADEEALAVAYGRKIRNNLGVHEEIMKLYRWGLENNLIKWTLIEFIGSSKWENLKYIKEHPEMLSQFVNVDIMKDLN